MKRGRVKLAQEEEEDADGPRDEAGKWHHDPAEGSLLEREQTFKAEECAHARQIRREMGEV